jgi:cell wall-associated NlpC family hydrolase
VTTPGDVIREARGWKGTPFHHQGRVRAGIDCVGLVIVVARALRLVAPDFDFAAYGRCPTGELDSELRAHCREIPAPIPGCVLKIKWFAMSHHVAIYTGASMIHAHQGFRDGTAEHRFDAKWRTRCIGFYALPGVTYER